MLRPNHVLVRGYTVDGDEIEIEASELMGRLVPARDRPPAGCADVRSDDAGATQGSDDRVPPAAGSAADRGSEASLEIAVTARRAAAPLGVPRHAGDGGAAAASPGRCRLRRSPWSSLAIDKRRGRGSQLMPSPVKAAAIELGLPVSHSVDDVLAVGADLGVVVAFGQLIKPHVLDAVPMVNLHFSLLPRWRGAAPVERALLAGDTETGVCLMQLEEGLDTGPVYSSSRGADRRDDDRRRASTRAGRGRHAAAHRRAASRARTSPTPQDGEPTYAAKLASGGTADRLDAVARRDRPAGAARRCMDDAATASVCEIVAVELVEPAAPPSDELRGDRVGGLRLVTVQPEGRGADAVRRVRPRRSSGRRRARSDAPMPVASATMTNARQVAYRCLQRIDHDGAYANLLLQSELGRSKLSERDRGFVTELVYGTTRMRRGMRCADRSVPDEGAAAGAAHVAAARCVPTALRRRWPHTRLSVRPSSWPRRRPEVSSTPILRRVGDTPMEWPNDAVRLSYPDWIVDSAACTSSVTKPSAAMARMNEPAPVSVRDDGYRQDLASQWVASAVEARPGERILDLCAAPGGKATAMAASGATSWSLRSADRIAPD